MTAVLRRGLAAAGALTLASAALLAMGRGPLATPPVGSFGTVTGWYEAVGPASAAMALVRVSALLVTLWLLVATVLQLLRAVTSLAWLASLGSLADLVSPRSLQRLGHGLAGLSLTAGLAAPAPSAGTSAGVVTSTTPAGWSDDDPSLPPAPPAEPAWPADEGAATTAGTATMRLLRDDVPVGVPSPDVVTVAVGDSLWSIASEELGALRGSPPSAREVEAYWRQVIAANGSVLVDPGNPDLIYPGQVLTLPPLGR